MSPARPRVPTPTAVREWTLGRDHYRRSEESWEEAGSPTARVRLEPSELGVRVVVEASAAHPLRVNAEGTENAWDNEPADVNADGVQLYVTGPGGNGGWRLALRPGGAVGIAPIPGWGALTPANAQWRETPGGYEVSVMLPLRAPARGAPLHFALDVLVNDIGPGRARRRGQLVMSGASGEWTYLRGDRHDPGRLIPIVLTR